jgi:phosphoribosylanthranilate isomerase
VEGLAECGRGGAGTGETFDWSVAAAVQARRPTFVAGGLTPDNVAACVAKVNSPPSFRTPPSPGTARVCV